MSSPVRSLAAHGIVLIALWLGSVSSLARADSQPVATLFAPFATLLEKHLHEQTLANNGLVSAFDYQAALADPDSLALLREQRLALRQFNPEQLSQRPQALAFWNNAYNFFIIDQILSERPGGQLVASVWDYGGRYNPLRKHIFEREQFNVGGRQYSLDGIEKGILLGEDFAAKGWKDARVHFTVNCASVGCPPLRKQIYHGANMDQLLAENTRRALNSPLHLRQQGKRLYLTSLFDWYEQDFIDANGSVVAFIRAHGSSGVAEKLEQSEQIRYIDYDWRLNSPANTAGLSRSGQ